MFGRRLSGKRQQTICVVVALLCYYVPGLVVGTLTRPGLA